MGSVPTHAQPIQTESADLRNAEEEGGAQRMISLWVGHTESDNAMRTATPGRGAYDSVGAELDMLRERSRLSAGLVGDIEFRTYQKDIAEDETIGFLNAFADAGVVPDRFTWSFAGSHSQGRSDPFRADTPENRESVLTFSTGPSFDVPLGDRTSLLARGTSTRREYDESLSLDSDAVSYGVGVTRRVRRSTSVGLTAQTTEIEYDSGTPGYEIASMQLNYERTLSQGEVTAAVGSNEARLGETESSDPMFQLTWQRNLTSRSGLAMSAERGFTDAGQLFDLDPAELSGIPPDALLVADVTDQKRFSLTYTFTLPRTEFSIQAASLSDSFQRDAAYNGDAKELMLEISRVWTPAFSTGADIYGTQRDFVDIDEDNTQRSFSLWANIQLGPRVVLALDFLRDRSDGVDVFREDSYRISFVYTRDRSVRQ